MNTYFQNPAEDEVLISQMKIVERVVRPLLASNARKRKIRDELLIHLSATYDEELARHNDPFAALAAAGKRFGSPAELTAELQATVPWIEQAEARLEPIFGWRAPETALRWMVRMGFQMGLLMAIACAAASIFALREFGWTSNVWLAIRPLVASMIVLPLSVAMSGFCHFKMRDHIFGVFGSRKSWGQAIAWAMFLAVATVACGFTFLTVAYGGFSPAAAGFYPCIAAGIIWAMGMLVFARIGGPQEIRDTVWAILDLKDEAAAAE